MQFSATHHPSFAAFHTRTISLSRHANFIRKVFGAVIHVALNSSLLTGLQILGASGVAYNMGEKTGLVIFIPKAKSERKKWVHIHSQNQYAHYRPRSGGDNTFGSVRPSVRQRSHG